MRRLFIIFVFLLPASAQVLQFAGGSSSLYQGTGGAITAYLPNSTMKLSAGTFQGRFGVGISDSFKFKGLDLTTGDSAFGFSVDGTGGVGIAVRGLSVQKENPNRTLAAFVGSTGPSYYLPFFQATKTQHIGSGIFYRQKVHNWTFESLGAFDGGKHTALQSAAYTGRWVRFSGGGGLQSSQKTSAGLLDIRPIQQFHITAMRQDIFWRDERATVNSLGAYAALGHFNLQGSILNGKSAGHHLAGQTFGAGAHFGLLSVQSSFYQSNRRGVLVTNASESFRHWQFSQSVNASAGRPSFGLGGGYRSNHFSISLDHSEQFLPFAGRGFQQVTSISLSIRLPHDTGLNLGASLLPDGPRYTASADSYATGPIKGSSLNPACRRMKTGRHVVSGTVTDSAGMPFPGATITLGGQTLISDSTGTFFLRVRKTKPLPIHVRPSEFVTPGCWRVVWAPGTAIPDSAPFHIIVERKP